jgi:hypothetical protein
MLVAAVVVLAVLELLEVLVEQAVVARVQKMPMQHQEQQI